MANPLEQINQQVSSHLANTGSYVLPTQQPQQPQHQGLDPRAWISEILGTAGMVGGGILGGPVGAAAGGALLGGVGKALEQKAHGENLNLGQVGQEAGMNALFGYGPLRALGKVTGVTTSKLLAGAAGKAVASPATTREGINLLGQAWGLHPSISVSGQPLGFAKAGQLQNFLVNKVGVPTTANASVAQNLLEPFKKNLGTQISDTVANNATNFDKKALISDLTTRFKTVYGINWETNTTAQNILKDVNGAKTTQDLWAVRKNIDKKLVNSNANPDAAMANNNALGTEARQAINTQLTTAHPELKTQFADYNKAADANPLVAKAAKNPPGAQVPILGNKVGGSLIQRGKAVIGSKMQGIGNEAVAQTNANTFMPKPNSFLENVMQGGAGRTGTMANLKPSNIGGALQGAMATPQPIIGKAIKGGIVRQGLAGAYGGAQQAVGPTDQTNMGQTSIDMTGQNAQQSSENPLYPKQNLLYDIASDPKNAQNYIKYYQSLQSVFGPQTNKLTVQQQATSDVQKLTANAMQQLQSGAVKTGPFGILGKLEQAKGAINMADPSTLKFNTTVANLMATIARARAGTAFTPNEQKLLEQYTPHIGDSYQQLVVKLNALQQQFGTPGSSTGAAGNQSNSQQLTDLLMQMSQGAQ